MTNFINSDKLLIDEVTFKSMTPSSMNVTDTQSIFYSIAMSQKSTIKHLLGDDLYADLIRQYTLYVDSGVSMESHYFYITENYLKPILSFATYKRLISQMSFKLKDGGYRFVTDMNSELASSDDRNTARSELTNDIDTFIKDCKKYIYDNKAYFPLYDKGFQNVNSNTNTLTIGSVNKPRRYSSGEQNVILRDDKNR